MSANQLVRNRLRLVALETRNTDSLTLGENMKNLKRLGVSFTLMCVLAMATFAGETNSPPCAPPDPGEVNSPPCAGGQMLPGDSLTPGDTSAPPALNAGDSLSVAELAVDLLQRVLSLF